MNIAIIGCGGVGTALLALLEQQYDLLAKENLHIHVLTTDDVFLPLVVLQFAENLQYDDDRKKLRYKKYCD